MRKTIVKNIFLVLVLAVIQGGLVQAVQGQAVAQVTSSADDLPQISIIPLFTQPQMLRQPHNSSSFWFYVPQGSFIESFLFNLHLDISETLLTEYSTITLSINNVVIASENLVDISTESDSFWKVPVPVERIKTDGTLNELTIVTAQRSIIGECADIDNPANWVVLLEDSNLQINAQLTWTPNLGQFFPYFFNRVDQYNTIKTNFVVEGTNSKAVNETLLNIASASGAVYQSKDLVDFSVSNSMVTGNDQNNVIIGLRDSQVSSVDLPDLAPGDGSLSLKKDASGNQLYVIGADEAGLDKVGRFFTNYAYLNQLSGDTFAISTLINENKIEFEKKEDGLYTLADFGYESVNLAGVFHQSRTYNLRQPDGFKSGSGSYIRLNFRHAETLIPDISLLTVYINNVPLGSIQLSDSNAHAGSITVAIPEEALDSRVIELRVDAYNYIGKIDCSKDYYDSAWTLIDKNSVVYFEPGDRSILPSLSQFPNFTEYTKQAVHSAVMLLPEDASDELLSGAAELATRASQNSGNTYQWKFLNDVDTLQDHGDSDIIIMGSYASIKIPDEISTDLYAVPDAQGNYAIKNEFPVTQEALSDQIVFQVIRSPWNLTRRIYVITYPAVLETDLSAFFASRSNVNQLGGYLSLVDEKFIVRNVTGLSVDGTQKIPLTPERAVAKMVLSTGITRRGLLFIAILLLIIIVLIVANLISRKNFEKTRSKMRAQNEANLMEPRNLNETTSGEQKVNEDKSNLSEKEHSRTAKSHIPDRQFHSYPPEVDLKMRSDDIAPDKS